jgi:protoporphyrin/coproporphyrin ferrochelatase
MFFSQKLFIIKVYKIDRANMDAAKHHQKPLKTAVLLLNLGTPESPSTKDVRKYLREFLSDPRVVNLPRALWLPILYGIILPFRSPKSAKKYQTIWREDGSPLKIYTQNQTQKLQNYFKEHQPDLIIEYAMRYGTPSIESVLAKFREQNVHQILILPLYPQYSATTTATCIDKVMEVFKKYPAMPSIHTINRYHDHPEYIKALAVQIQRSWDQNGRPDFTESKLLFSFHGIPEANLLKGDYYHCECLKTARLVAEYLGLDRSNFQVSFQSRLGRAKWLEPYTDITLQKLATQYKRVDVICPGFFVDCLETLEEIHEEGQEIFKEHGGQVFNYIDCFNDEDLGSDLLIHLIKQHLAPWKTIDLPVLEGFMHDFYTHS